MLIYVEFAGIHHKLHKQGLFNLNVNWPTSKSVPFNRPRPTNKTVDASQWGNGKFDPLPRPNPLTDRQQK